MYFGSYRDTPLFEPSESRLPGDDSQEKTKRGRGTAYCRDYGSGLVLRSPIQYGAPQYNTTEAMAASNLGNI